MDRGRRVDGQLTARADEMVSADSSEYVRAASDEVHDAYRLAGYLLGDAAEAHDAVQDALLKAWRNWSSLRETSAFRPWFSRIVINVCRDRMRRSRTVRLVAIDTAEEVESADAFATMFLRDEVAAGVARLKPDHRVVVVLHFWQDLTLEQVAQTLDLPIGTVKSRLHAALVALRKELGETNDED